MNEPYPSSYAPPPIQPSRPQGMGCFVKGCLTVGICFMLLGVLLGGFGWMLYRSATTEYLTHDAVAIRTFPATEEQYNAVMAKFQTLSQAMNNGTTQTTEFTGDDINVLIARDPRFTDARGKVYVTIADGQIVADVSTPIPDVKPESPGPRYASGRAAFDASFADGEFALVLRHVGPLSEGKSAGLVSRFINRPDYLQVFSERLTRSLNDSIARKSGSQDTLTNVLNHLRTIVIHNNRIVATSLEGGAATPGLTVPTIPVTPPPPPVAPGEKTE